MIKVQCTINGEPLAEIPETINYKFQKGLELFCFETNSEYLEKKAIELPEDAELLQIQEHMAKKAAKIALGLSQIAWYDGFMDSKGFDNEPKVTRKAIKAILKPLYAELGDGQLKGAIDEIKSLTNPQFDGVYLRKSKILKVRNAIEEHLGISPLSVNYND